MSRRVLVIEPDTTVRRMLEYALSAAGFAPVSTPTVEAARPLLDGKPVDWLEHVTDEQYQPPRV